MVSSWSRWNKYRDRDTDEKRFARYAEYAAALLTLKSFFFPS